MNAQFSAGSSNAYRGTMKFYAGRITQRTL